jgi:catechol 2,3-dioxygenase
MSSASWPLNQLTLKVLHLEDEVEFYKSFGFQLLNKDDHSALLHAGEGTQLALTQLVKGKPRPHKTAGLFHFALLLPDRASLGSFIRYVSEKSFHFVGAANHLVSEALYFSDMEGNGIEVYADRPRENWQWNGTSIVMDTLALNLRELARLPGREWKGFPLGTRLGHMHLTVSDLDASQAFYETLGLELTLDWGSFRFFSWEGYHHHLAINLAAGRDAKPVRNDVAGLHSFSVARKILSVPGLDPNGIVVETQL